MILLNINTGVDPKVSLSGLEALSETDVIDSIFSDAPEKEENDNDGTDAPNNEQNENLHDIQDLEIPGDKSSEKKEEDKKAGDEKVDNKEVDKKDKKEDVVNDDEDELEIPGEEKKPEIKAGEEEESSWVAVAKDLGYELKEDSYESFKTVLESEKTKIREEVLAEYKTKEKDEVIKELPLEAQMVVLGLQSGLTLEQINKPFQQIDDLLALSDVDLIAKDLELQDMSPELVEKKLLLMQEKDGEIEIEAFQIRKFLNDSKNQLKEKNLNDLTALKQKREAEKTQLIQKDTNEIHESLKKTPKILESKISDKHVNYVVEKWKKGEYQALFKDSDFIAQALLQYEFGDKAASLLAKKKFEEGRNGIVNKLHNIPVKTKGSQGQSVVPKSGSDTPIGNFGFLNEISPDEL